MTDLPLYLCRMRAQYVIVNIQDIICLILMTKNFVHHSSQITLQYQYDYQRAK